jgi:hypothetical protein
MDVIWHRLGSWAFALAPSENDHIGPQVAHKVRKQIRGQAARGCALEWNYVETAVQQTGSGPSAATGRIGSPGFLGYDARQEFLKAVLHVPRRHPTD